MVTHDAVVLVADLQAQGIELAVHGGQLRCRPASAATPEVRARVAPLREHLIDLLSGEPERLAPRSDTDGAPVHVEFELTPSRAGHPHDVPWRPCYTCGGIEFVRVQSGPMWICPRCRPPHPGATVVERMSLSAAASVGVTREPEPQHRAALRRLAGRLGVEMPPVGWDLVRGTEREGHWICMRTGVIEPFKRVVGGGADA